MQSVFTDVGKVCVQDAVQSFTMSFAQNPVTSSAWLSTHGHAHFALATPSGGITIVTLSPHDQQGKNEHAIICTFINSNKNFHKVLTILEMIAVDTWYFIYFHLLNGWR